MAYRGEELDLRVPQGWGTGREQTSAQTEPNWYTRTTVYQGGRADTLWVDDKVMAVVNHAYDLAVAHRAPEVRLEHLLNAMTLNEATAAVLDARGIGVPALRRESGAIVASEIPTGPTNGKGPKRSEALEETLRHAADRAYPRRTPVTIDDVLHVMLDMKRDVPGLNLLRRHAPSWAGRPGEPRGDFRLDPLPHLSQPGYQPEPPRFTPPEDPRPRYASPAAHAYFTEPPRLTRDASSGSVDERQNNRLDAIERAMRDLQRSSAAQTHSIETAFQRARSEGGAVPPALIDRLLEAERTQELRFSDMSRDWSALGDRLSGLEQAVSALSRHGADGVLPLGAIEQLDALPALDRKIDSLERTFGQILARLAELERNIQSRIAQSVDLTPVTELLSGIETRTDAAQRATTQISERLAGLERLMENRAAETGRTVSFIGERLRAFEESIAGQRQQTARVEQLISAGSDKQVGERLAQIERSIGAYAERSIEAGLDQQKDLKEVHEAIVQLSNNQRLLQGLVEDWRAELMGDVSNVSNRLSKVESRQPAIDNVVSTMGVLQTVIAKREERKSRFRHWLFGTDDWYTPSWDPARWRTLKKAQMGLEKAAAIDMTPRPAPPPKAPPVAAVKK